MDHVLLAWGLSWAPFVGSFIARISRGRSIREFVLGIMIVPVLLSMLWFSTFGGSAIYFELFEQAGIAAAVTQEVPAGLYVMLDQLPGGYYTAIVTVLLVSMFVVTSADSATFVLGMFTSRGVLNRRGDCCVYAGRLAAIPQDKKEIGCWLRGEASCICVMTEPASKHLPICWPVGWEILFYQATFTVIAHDAS